MAHGLRREGSGFLTSRETEGEEEQNMARFVVYVHDEQAGTLVRAYSVNVTHEKVYVSPYQDGWAETARRLEDALNAGSVAGSSRPADSAGRQMRLT